MEKIYLDYEEENKYGKINRVKGLFELVKENDDYIIINSGKNQLQISRKDIRKLKIKRGKE